MMVPLSDRANQVAKSIEHAEGAEDAQLIGSTVTDVDYVVGRDLTLKEITVQFNSRHATIRVDLYSGALTAAEGFGESVRVPLFPGGDKNTEAVLEEAKDYWEMQAEADGLNV
jgi:hypothetical protein